MCHYPSSLIGYKTISPEGYAYQWVSNKAGPLHVLSRKVTQGKSEWTPIPNLDPEGQNPTPNAKHHYRIVNDFSHRHLEPV